MNFIAMRQRIRPPVYITRLSRMCLLPIHSHVGVLYSPGLLPFWKTEGERKFHGYCPMTVKEKFLRLLNSLYQIVDAKIQDQFNFGMKDVTFNKIVDYLHQPRDSSSLAVTRILFGLCMLLDIPDERGGAIMEKRWGNPNICHFPLIPFIQAMPMPYMALIYGAMWFGALGIMLGYKYRLSSTVFTICHWYILLIDKSFWNNHSYLFGLVALLLCFTNANCLWSLDAHLDATLKSDSVPCWNYFILKYQFFILYFMAGLKKGTAEWLTGYSVQNLAEHWVFGIFKLFLTEPQINYFIVHWFIFLFDLTIAFWMMWSPTRHYAMVFCALFHLMNSRLFRIGMFPWVCLATQPLFYPFDWPKRIKKYLEEYFKITKEKLLSLCNCVINKINNKVNDNNEGKANCTTQKTEEDITDEPNENPVTTTQTNNDEKQCYAKQKATNIKRSVRHENGNCHKLNDLRNKTRVCIILLYMSTQAFLPFSHFITKGYNNWTNGLYGYSWDMMVHSWNSSPAVIRVVDKDNDKEIFIKPDYHSLNERWTKHGDMVYQYAKCLKRKLQEDAPELSNNISIYIDVWSSMNERFIQRMFNPKIDLLQASWSPFEEVSFLMPLLDEALAYREKLLSIKEEVHSWSNESDVVFFADFPGYYLEKYIPPEITNITLTVMDGTVVYEPDITRLGQSNKLIAGEYVMVDSGLFHKVHNIGHKPAFYMYTFYSKNITENKDIDNNKLPIMQELTKRLLDLITFAGLVFKNVYKLFFGCQCH